ARRVLSLAVCDNFGSRLLRLQQGDFCGIAFYVFGRGVVPDAAPKNTKEKILFICFILHTMTLQDCGILIYKRVTACIYDFS
ncbi:MAG: hypothetical protein JW892_12605, partial [Anaerolineae bacterium]|nr:hypothetical protein [Anaerolineae bacterium]